MESSLVTKAPNIIKKIAKVFGESRFPLPKKPRIFQSESPTIQSVTDPIVNNGREDGLSTNIATTEKTKNVGKIRLFLLDEIEKEANSHGSIYCHYTSYKTGIAGGQLDICIDKKLQTLKARCRLNVEAREAVLQRCAENQVNLRSDQIGFYSEIYGQFLKITQARSFITEGFVVRISSAETDSAAEGLLIELESRTTCDKSNLQQQLEGVERIFAQYLSTPEVFSPPSPEEQDVLKIKDYLWQHKIDFTTLTPAEARAIADRLSESLLSDTHKPVLESGANSRYREEFGFYAIYHTLYGNALVRVLKSGGVLSTYDRLSRGIDVESKSPGIDLLTGGGFKVFTRMVTQTGINVSRDCDAGGGVLIFKPDLLDRTDWFAYPRDRYGSLSEIDLEERMTPEEIFDYINKEGSFDEDAQSVKNEQMFNRGIGIEFFYRYAVHSSELRDGVLAELRAEGISRINGEPIEAFVVVGTMTSEIIKHANTAHK